ncbi:hypothetical protein [Bifidobacterium apri]|uniref:Uncharacterized protein n=1 Tax=Bifidobacterium apri TaxID=1769423 RepID=A0A6A2V874_9BIFI|nr:hypothetical protein [Bifidobacterium apri]KAB8298369.1 hypothetical protein DSM100238_1056 [Bifidobacterium apri]
MSVKTPLIPLTPVRAAHAIRAGEKHRFGAPRSPPHAIRATATQTICTSKPTTTGTTP